MYISERKSHDSSSKLIKIHLTSKLSKISFYLFGLLMCTQYFSFLIIQTSIHVVCDDLKLLDDGGEIHKSKGRGWRFDSWLWNVLSTWHKHDIGLNESIIINMALVLARVSSWFKISTFLFWKKGISGYQAHLLKVDRWWIMWGEVNRVRHLSKVEFSGVLLVCT